MTDRDGPVFRLFACCQAVRGARRATICDLQRGTYHLIPLGLYDILTAHRDRTLEGVKALFGPEDEDRVDQYFAFLLERQLGFWTHEPERFPDLDLSWDSPSTVINALVDLDQRSDHDFDRLVAELDELRCVALELRFFDPVPSARLRAILDTTRASGLRSVELLLPFDPGWASADLDALCRDHPRISRIVVHSAPRQELVESEDLRIPIFYSPQVIDSDRCCGQVNPDYFVVGIGSFTEAQRFNTCLNRKIALDVRGNIKNCPSMPDAYGRFPETSLRQALAEPGLRARWSVHKDEIEVCRDCEFRYLCVDCRAFVADPDNPRSKPAKCSYDPYTATWEEPPPAGVEGG